MQNRSAAAKVKKSDHAKVPTHLQEMARLKRIKGQLDGIEKMILDRRYCPEIIMQVKAAYSAMKSLEASILKTHLRHCVKDAMTSKGPFEAEQKIQEIVDIIIK